MRRNRLVPCFYYGVGNRKYLPLCCLRDLRWVIVHRIDVIASLIIVFVCKAASGFPMASRSNLPFSLRLALHLQVMQVTVSPQPQLERQLGATTSVWACISLSGESCARFTSSRHCGRAYQIFWSCLMVRN